MSKVASAAATLGVGEEQLAAQLSTIISVTRQAPETVGTALRTVYARITDIEAGLDEDGVTLGKYSGDMAKIGINVLDLNGNLRNMGEVMEEIGNKWSTMTQEQKIYLAQTMAGQRQYSNLMALFDNFDKYESALNTAQNAEGKLQEQQDIYMDRLSAHVQQLTTATEHMWMGLVDTDGFKDVIDGLTTIVEKVDKLFQSIGGGKNLLQSLVPIVMLLTSKTVASGINTMIMNSQLEKRQLRDQKSSQVLAQKEVEAL
jgi:TP901 family phage tail tape measure protein